jgi:FAD/FMN-containing dehydrogenase
MLGEAAEAGLVLDATVAVSQAQARALWKIRESIPEAQNRMGPSVKHDISVPVSKVAAFIEEASAALRAAYPGLRVVAFGHLGDGNIHFNPAGPVGDTDFYGEREKVNRIVHDIVSRLDGSISAEHGLGRLRREEARLYKPAVEMELMRRIKQAIDPANLMNPGKVV